MTKYIVTKNGPIDRWPPGADVTAIYDAVTIARLIDDGYVKAIEPKKRRKMVSNGS